MHSSFRLLAVAACASLLFACAKKEDGAASSSGELTTDAQKFGYAIGVDLGNSLKPVQSHVDIKALEAGLNDVTSGATPKLDDAARVEGASPLQVLMKVYVPLARPTYIAYGLVSVSYHWNNFLWPLLVTNSVESRPLTVGLQVFSSADQGIDWAVICAATLMTSAPLLVGFLLFQRQFVQSFMRAGIK